MRKFIKYYLVAALFLFIFLTRIFWVINSQPLSSFTSIEEQFFDVIAARNFLNFGFLKTLFLPDYVSSRFIQDHPMVYTHMPPMEALLPGIFMKLGLGVLGARIFYVIFNTLGFFYVYLFFSQLINRVVALFVVFFAANNFFNAFINADHFNHGLSILLIFSAAFHFLNLDKRQPSSSKTYHFVAMFLAVFFTSVTSYYVSIVQFTFLTSLFLFNFSKPGKKTFYLIGSAAVFGIILHLGQNYFFLGQENFFQDIVLTFKNRIFGSPTTREMIHFFNQGNIVCWGAPYFSKVGFTQTLIYMLQNQFEALTKYKFVFKLFLISLPINLVIMISAKQTKDLIKFIKIIISLSISGISFAFFLPALTQGYPIDVFFGTTGAVALAFLILPITFGKIPRLYLISFLIFICIIFNFFISNRKDFTYALKEERYNSTYKKFAQLQKYSQEVIWTNLTYSYISYFTENVVAGRCTLEAIAKKDIDLCDNVIINADSANRKFLSRPTIFVFSKGYLSGNMACGNEECLSNFENYLRENYLLIEVIDDIYVFRISK